MEEVQDSQLTDKELHSYPWPHSSTKSLAGVWYLSSQNIKCRVEEQPSAFTHFQWIYVRTPLLYACSRLAAYSIFKTCPIVLSCTHYIINQMICATQNCGTSYKIVKMVLKSARIAPTPYPSPKSCQSSTHTHNVIPHTCSVHPPPVPHSGAVRSSLVLPIQ